MFDKLTEYRTLIGRAMIGGLLSPEEWQRVSEYLGSETPPPEKPAHWIDRIEPATYSGSESPEQAVRISQAISLKRIADALSPGADGQTFFDKADNWFHSWLGIWNHNR